MAMTLALAWLLLLLGLEPGADVPAGNGPRATPAPAPPTHAPAAATHARIPPSAAALRRAAQDGPPVDALRTAASALALAEPARARSLVQRARWSAWLPEVRFRVDRRFGRSESLDVSPAPLGDAPPVALDTVDEVRYEARASWDLSRLIFNPDELSAHGEALRIAEVRREIEGLVIHLYFERRRLKVEAAAADGNDVASNLRRDARIEELEAELDALTGGAFSRATSSKAPSATAPPVVSPSAPAPASP
jgi:hypothetical protein